MAAHQEPGGGEGEPAIGSRWPEIGVAAFLAAVAALVIADSLRVGIGWADDGPRSGYFPFGIGVILLAASTWVLASRLLRGRLDHAEFAQRAQLASVFAVLLPMVVYVAMIKPVGIYLASALLIAWFMRRHGPYRWLITLPVAVAVPLLFFLVFERWFVVPLPKGPIERALGF
jgi:putative tricarboxylic transport membrane protein